MYSAVELQGATCSSPLDSFEMLLRRKVTNPAPAKGDLSSTLPQAEEIWSHHLKTSESVQGSDLDLVMYAEPKHFN